MEKVITQQKEFISSLTSKKPSDDPIENMELIKSEMSLIVRNKDKSFQDKVKHNRADRLYKSILDEIEVLSKARDGLVAKKITVQGKNGSYQKTVWVRSGDANKTEKKSGGDKNKEGGGKEKKSVDSMKRIADKMRTLARTMKDMDSDDYESAKEKITESREYKSLSEEQKKTIDEQWENIDGKFDMKQREKNLNDDQLFLKEYFDKDLKDSWQDLAEHGAGGGFPGITYTKDNLNHLKNHRSYMRDTMKDMISEGLFGDEENPEFSLFRQKFDEEQTEQVMNYLNYGDLPEDNQVIDFIAWAVVENIAQSLYRD